MSAPLDPELARLDLDEEIARLKRARNAVILAHYYQDGEIQDLADFIGDSLQLAQAAMKTAAEVILFAGVHFMAEVAKILNPRRVVLVPDMAAGCSLADNCPVDRFTAWRARHPGALAVSYINCSAAVKAESDYICTSSNAAKIVAALPADREILFAPDRNLGRWVAKETKRPLVLWPGSCIVHETFSARRIIELRHAHSGAKLISHPECEEPVLAMSDFVGSTAALLRYVERDDAASYIVATEPGILHQMRKLRPDKSFHVAPATDETCACNQCPHMRLNTPEKVFLALKHMEPRLEMDPELRERARVPITRMLELS